MFNLLQSTVLERSQSVFEGFINAGTASKSWFAIFSLLQRLRQACDHVSLTVNKKLETGQVARHLNYSHELTRVDSSSNDIMEGGKVDENVSSSTEVSRLTWWFAHITHSYPKC